MAAAAGRVHGFHREGSDWFCNAALLSDVIVTVEGISFHLHKFPLISKCGKIALSVKESSNSDQEDCTLNLEDFPGGPDSFLLAAKFCYGVQVELTPRNVVTVYCAAYYLEMTDEYGEGNLLSKCESYFHKNILRNWKDCIVALQNSEPVFPLAERLQLVRKCMNAVSMMVCTDPSLFGWPMKMYGSLQSPGGSILWNGINTGARIRSSESEWWFEDVSYLSVRLFEMLIKTMERRGVRPENLAAALLYYARKYLPGLGRWQSGKTRTVASFSLTPVTIDQRALLECIVRLLPDRKGKSFCRFLLGLLRVASILNADRACKDALEKKIGQQLDLATLDSLLLPSYSDSDTLYDTDCIERIVTYYVSLELKVSSFSPSSFDLETSPSSGPLVRVAKLMDAYLAEVASDVNLKPQKIRALAEALPDSSRPLYDGLYRAVDVYFKAHPWLSDKEKEDMCTIIDYQKLTMDACAHASQNERLPLRVVLQVLFFEQMQLRKALASCLHAFDAEDGAEAPVTIPSAITGQIVQRDGWVPVVRENQVLKVDVENMRSRVGELEEEFSRIKQDMRKISKSCSSMASPRISLSAWKIGCRLIPRPSDRTPHQGVGSGETPRMSVEEARPSRHSKASEELVFGLNSRGTSVSRKRG